MNIKEITKDDVMWFILSHKEDKEFMTELNKLTFIFSDRFDDTKISKYHKPKLNNLNTRPSISIAESIIKEFFTAWCYERGNSKQDRINEKKIFDVLLYEYTYVFHGDIYGFEKFISGIDEILKHTEKEIKGHEFGEDPNILDNSEMILGLLFGFNFDGWDNLSGDAKLLKIVNYIYEEYIKNKDNNKKAPY